MYVETGYCQPIIKKHYILLIFSCQWKESLNFKWISIKRTFSRFASNSANITRRHKIFFLVDDKTTGLISEPSSVIYQVNITTGNFFTTPILSLSLTTFLWYWIRNLMVPVNIVNYKKLYAIKYRMKNFLVDQ